jgi:signal transduction histidine kinase
MKNVAFLEGGGEMGERTRQLDWSRTLVGSPDQWPGSLRTIVSAILSSRHPMFLWWGQDLIQFYNDAYRPSLGDAGKHPAALGQKGVDCWPEIWDIIYPLIHQVLTTGKSTWSEDQLVPIYRNGAIEDVYWTFGYSPVRDDDDRINGVLVICTETTQKVTYLQQLLESKNETEFAIDAADLATWDLNPHTNRFTANARLTEWFGLEPTAEIALPDALAAIHIDDRQRVATAIQHALDPSSGGYYNIEHRIINAVTQRERIVVAKGRARFDEQNRPFRFNGIIQDITEQAIARRQIEGIVNERTRELAEANRNLERSNAELSQFAYIASHDLQEPIRKVAIYADILREYVTAEEPNNYLKKIITASERMQTLVRDILAYSEVSKQSPIFEPVGLQAVVEGLLSEFDLRIEQTGAKITCTDLPVIDAIPLQMVQLFGNLLSNALKYIKPGVAPVITITAAAEATNYHIQVQDNGIGFDQQYAGQIFSIFQRLHRKAQYSGTGIGLALCKKIVENHRGQIFATSSPGEGANFHIILPITVPLSGENSPRFDPGFAPTRIN